MVDNTDTENDTNNDLRMDLMKYEDLKLSVATGNIDIKDILNVPSINKHVTYNLTFTEHIIQLRVNNKTELYLLDCLEDILYACKTNIISLLDIEIVGKFINQVMTEWGHDENISSKEILERNNDELDKIDTDDSCPTTQELKTYEKTIKSTELDDIINTIGDFKKRKDDLEHNALNARVEMNYLNCNYHPTRLKIAAMDDVEEKRDKLKEMCEECNKFQLRIKKCVNNYKILLEHDKLIYEDVVIDLSTRDSYKYNEYIRNLVKDEKLNDSVLYTINNDLDKISNIEIIFSNIIYLCNFIKKERLYTLNILQMFMNDINVNYLSENCDLSKLKLQLDTVSADSTEHKSIKNVVENIPETITYSNGIEKRILEKINKRRGDKGLKSIEPVMALVEGDLSSAKLDYETAKLDGNKYITSEDKLNNLQSQILQIMSELNMK
jgi:hypothetical protein